jgi:hypothetical protein
MPKAAQLISLNSLALTGVATATIFMIAVALAISRPRPSSWPTSESVPRPAEVLRAAWRPDVSFEAGVALRHARQEIGPPGLTLQDYSLRGRKVFDSQPVPSELSARFRLVQHMLFYGSFSDKPFPGWVRPALYVDQAWLRFMGWTENTRVIYGLVYVHGVKLKGGGGALLAVVSGFAKVNPTLDYVIILRALLVSPPGNVRAGKPIEWSHVVLCTVHPDRRMIIYGGEQTPSDPRKIIIPVHLGDKSVTITVTHNPDDTVILSDPGLYVQSDP